MGMFDNIKCNFPLPEATKEVQEGIFQTKNLDCVMDNYTITKEGTLIHHQVEYKVVPDEQRPYYGKPEWNENPLFQLIGSLRTIPVRDYDRNYHGIIIMYNYLEDSKEWFEYELEFTRGLLTNVKRLYKEYGGSNG